MTKSNDNDGDATTSQPGAPVADRERALALADEIGVSAAARELGIPVGTVKSWRSRTGRVSPPAGVDQDDWVARKQRGADDAWKTANAALKMVNSLLAAGQTADAQRAALTMAIALDKSAMLEAAANAQRERDLRRVQGQAEVIYAVLEAYHAALDLPFTFACRRVLADLLRQAADGKPLSPRGPDAAEARAEVRTVVAGELRAVIEGELRARIEPEWIAERRGLPAPSDDADEKPESEQMAATVRVIRTIAPESVESSPQPPARRHGWEYPFSSPGRYSESEFG